MLHQVAEILGKLDFGVHCLPTAFQGVAWRLKDVHDMGLLFPLFAEPSRLTLRGKVGSRLAVRA